MSNQKFLPITKLKTKISKVIRTIEKSTHTYVVTKNGQPAAVIMSYDEWESWKETVEILSDTKARVRIQKNLAYFKRGGKGKSLDAVFGKAA